MRFFSLLLFIILSGTLPLSAASVREQKIAGRPSFDFYRLLQLNGARASVRGRGHLFVSRYFNCSVERNSRRAVINGTKVDLNFPVSYIGNRPYISKFDWVKSFRPLLYPGTLRKHRIGTVTIDMGHGGSDPGAIGSFSREKNITLRIGLRLGRILQSYGYRVYYTRRSDVKLPLERISALQRSHKSDLFVSIHVNSARDRSVSGVETFCLTPAFAPSSGSNKLQRKVQAGNHFDANNLALAYCIQRRMVYRTGAADRGVKRANFVVLRELSAPGVLVEVGFISNRMEERKLNNGKYIDFLARGIAEGIVSYRSLMK